MEKCRSCGTWTHQRRVRCACCYHLVCRDCITNRFAPCKYDNVRRRLCKGCAELAAIAEGGENT